MVGGALYHPRAKIYLRMWTTAGQVKRRFLTV